MTKMICAIVLMVTRLPFHFVVVPMHDDWSVNDCRKPARVRAIIESRATHRRIGMDGFGRRSGGRCRAIHS
ncbi:hypothetical protein [Aurantimonas sp. A3-2-R12]|uniref:hypothetical protein n=1 Tax=Aurantimonas sp. A3-2-R12 TaxID=3114362 RepID=UPI002E173B32|nr:hypothetical protein [Aurantimonas sp. A3-2-R12]